MKVAGFGFRSGATLQSLRTALDRAEALGGPATALATLPAKAKAPALRQLAQERGLALLVVPVAGRATPTQSPRILARFGTGSVAEAAALAAAGPDATLIVARLTAPDAMVTCAMAQGKGAFE